MPDVFKAEGQKSHKHTPPNVTRHKHLPDKRELVDHGHTKNSLSAYCYYPDHVRFVGADKEERIVLLLRRHGITNIPWILTSFFMVSIPVALWGLGFFDFIPLNFLIVGLISWYLISFTFAFERFLAWFFNVYIVTDERVFDVDFVHLVYREMTDANLDQIQDVTVKVGSVIRTIFDFGDIHIQTAAAVVEIDFEAVPHPDKVAQVLRELRVEEEQEKIEGRVR